MLVPIWLQINDRPMLSLSRPIYQNQPLGRMMIKRPDRRSLLGPRSHHGWRQLDLIALLSLGCEQKKRQLHWQVLLAGEATRAEESGMSHVLWVYVGWGLVIHFIKTYPLRRSWTFLRLTSVSPVFYQRLNNLRWVGTVVERGGILLKGNSSLIQQQAVRRHNKF